MNAVINIDRDLRRRESSGFATMYGKPMGVNSNLDITSTVLNTFVTSGPPIEKKMALLYSSHSAPKHIGASDQDVENRFFSAIQSDKFFVWPREDTATMGVPAAILVFELPEQYERGIVNVHVPRKVISTDWATMKMGEIPRKRPRVIISERIHEGDDA